MRRVSLVLMLFLFLSSVALAQPTVLGVLNSAGYMLPGMPNGGLTQGAMITAWLGGVPNFDFAKVSSLPLQKTFQGVSIQITVGPTTVDAIPMIVNANTVTFLVPSSTPLGTGNMRVTYNGQTGPPYSVEIVRSSFGGFTINQAGSGPVVMLNPTNGQPNLITNAAAPGQDWDIWGTGLGAVSGNEAAGPLPGDVRPGIDVKVYVGGKLAEVVYAGRSGCCIGIDQIRIRIPTGVSGCYVPVVVVINGVPSNSGTISIGSSTICSDPQGFNASQLQAIQQSGEGRIAQVGLNRLRMDIPGLGGQTNDSAVVTASRYDYNKLIRAQNFSAVYSRGACVVFAFKSSDNEESPTSPSGFDPISADDGLDAGQVSVTNSLGKKMLEMTSKGHYSASGSSLGFGGPLFLEKGPHTIAATGGVDIPAFSVSMGFPGDLDSNLSSITSVKTGVPLKITWSGSIPQAVVIMGTSINDAKKIGAMFYCTADGAAGQFTVPDYIVAAMPPSGVEENIDFGALALVAAQATTDLAIPNVDAAFGDSSNAVFRFGIAYQHDPAAGGGGGGGGGGGSFAVSSTSFANGAAIPLKHAAVACGGTNVSPQITFGSVPAGTQSLLVVMDDPDAGGFLHWGLTDIPPGTTSIPEGNPGDIGVASMNGFGQTGYGGPCPPAGSTHNYRIRVIALPMELGFDPGTSVAQFTAIVNGLSGFGNLGLATYTGTFGR